MAPHDLNRNWITVQITPPDGGHVTFDFPAPPPGAPVTTTQWVAAELAHLAKTGRFRTSEQREAHLAAGHLRCTKCGFTTHDSDELLTHWRLNACPATPRVEEGP